jgi:hypothetical protein
MSRVDYPDGTRVVRIKCEGLGDGLQLHWGCVLESADEWSPPPQGTNSSGGINGAWLHANVGDLTIPLMTPNSNATKILKALSSGENKKNQEHGTNLYNRFCRINDKLSESQQAGPQGAAAIFATLRLSAVRQLAWYAGGNYQGKDMAHMQKVICERMARASATAEDGMSRQLYRAALGTLPRGGGNGDDIRLGILQLMRDNGIKEGHRPGIEDPFIAQWHQKLHSNTTVDDIYICEAYLHFLHTGNWDDFWTHLWENHQLDPR